MQKYFYISVFFSLLLANTASAQSFKSGDWVLGNYQGSNYWFAGVVAEVGRGQIVVRYDDGEVETLKPNNVRPYDWKVGSKVECNYKSGGRWYSGKITGLSGERLAIAYDDGDKEQTKTGLCRSV